MPHAPWPAASLRRRPMTCHALALCLIGCVLVSALVSSGAGATESQTAPIGAPDGAPLWEVGVGAFSLLAPDYPAAGNSSVNGLPVPIFIYRGDLLRIGEEAPVRVVPVDEPRFELGISLGAAFGADSEDNDRREGLPDLNPLVEIGPELIIRGLRLRSGTRPPGRLDFVLEARTVYSLDFDDIALQYQGVVIEPGFRYAQPGLLGPESFVSVSGGPIFATERLHDYFYEVPPAFALADRPAFDAEGGYLGTELTVALGGRLSRRLQSFVGSQIGLYSGAANQDSALFEREVTFSVFAGLTYTLYESKRRIERRR